MIAIKAKDIYKCDEYDHLAILYDDFEQLKQQILQDHEDVKKLRSENQQLKYERIDLIINGKKDKEDAKKWREYNLEVLKICDEELDNWKKDRQIVKRLEERIDELIEEATTDCQKVITMNARKYCDCECCCLVDEFQKILDGKK